MFDIVMYIIERFIEFLPAFLVILSLIIMIGKVSK